MTNANKPMLPAAVRRHLPHHAQDLFRRAFNRAWRDYAGDPGREERALCAAWAAVNKVFVKTSGKWQPREHPWIPGEPLGMP